MLIGERREPTRGLRLGRVVCLALGLLGECRGQIFPGGEVAVERRASDVGRRGYLGHRGPAITDESPSGAEDALAAGERVRASPRRPALGCVVAVTLGILGRLGHDRNRSPSGARCSKWDKTCQLSAIGGRRARIGAYELPELG